MMAWAARSPFLTFFIILAILATVRYLVRGPAPEAESGAGRPLTDETESALNARMARLRSWRAGA